MERLKERPLHYFRIALLGLALATSAAHGQLDGGPTDVQWRATADCPNCEIVHQSQLYLPYSQQVAYSAKLYDPSLNQWLLVSRSGQGLAIDESVLSTQERNARTALMGKKDELLFNRLSSPGSSQELISIVIRVADGWVAPSRQTGTVDTSYWVAVRAGVTTALAPVVSWLSSRGYSYDAAGLIPGVRATIRREDIATLEELSAVRELQLDGSRTNLSTAWHSSVNAGPADALSLVSVATPAIGNQDYPDDHAQVVSGIIRNTFSTSSTVATSGQIMFSDHALWPSRNPLVPDAKNVYEWCQGPVSNNSNEQQGWRFRTPDNRDWDEYSVRKFQVFVTGSGNSGGDPTHIVSNKIYNELVVGAFDDRRTASLSDDVMAGFSSWKNTPSAHRDRQLPELVAPGVDITSGNLADSRNPTTLTGRMRNDGTSYASPVVAGVVALAHRADSMFYVYPQMLKAVILAAATRNIDGSAPQALHHILDGKDGVGAVDALRSVELAQASLRVPSGFAGRCNGHSFEELRESDFVDGVHRVWPKTYHAKWHIDVCKTGRLRVVAAWAVLDRGESAVPADIDLFIKAPPALRPKCQSVSFDNSYEFCDFSVVAGERLELELSLSPGDPLPSNGGVFTDLGLAWSNY